MIESISAFVASHSVAALAALFIGGLLLIFLFAGPFFTAVCLLFFFGANVLGGIVSFVYACAELIGELIAAIIIGVINLVETLCTGVAHAVRDIVSFSNLLICSFLRLLAWPFVGLIGYAKNKEILDRQREMEKWLKQKFDDFGIKFRFIGSRRRFLDLNECSYDQLAEVYSSSNLFFEAEVPEDKIADYKRIMGILCNKFPWVKFGPDGEFSPCRFLDRAWAQEYNLVTYAHPRLSDLCKCGCGRAIILDFRWRSLNKTGPNEIIRDDCWASGFDCRAWRPDAKEKLGYSGEVVNVGDLIILPSSEQLEALKKMNAQRR